MLCFLNLGFLDLIKKITENEWFRFFLKGFVGFRDFIDEIRKINFILFLMCGFDLC